MVLQPGRAHDLGQIAQQALDILRRVATARRIVGADVVEHAPLPGNRAPDFLVAKLCYKLLGYSLFPKKVPVLANSL